MSTHAQLSPSSAVRWMSCPGSVALCQGLPDTSSSHADEGTDAHELAALVLSSLDPCTARDYIGRTMPKGNRVTDEMAAYVQQYVDYVRGVAEATGGSLLVEQRLPISDITGEDDAHGTADAVILAPGELIVVDLKYGRGVPVDAEDNPQLQIYALAAMAEFGLVHDFSTVRMVIYRPRLNSVSEWVQTVVDLEAFKAEVQASAADCRHVLGMAERNEDEFQAMFLRPAEKACQWCKAKATCPALRDEVAATVGAVASPPASPAEFDDLTADTPTEHDPADWLASCLKKVDLIESWCKAVRAETESRLLAGKSVPGFKLVSGKKGNRAWTNADEVEALFKDTFRLKVEQMYDLKLVSPTTAEKLHKAEAIGPRQWAKVQALITQADGKPSVAPESDKRPALVMSATADDFEDVTTDLA